ncbi:HD-GYP domain-containing protein [Ferrimonas marina]|nr:HD-GYP domain-containing protein [Ferrimonas marina]
MKSVPLKHARVGMFVVEIPGHPALTLARQGLISSPELLAQMAREGVTQLIVDPSRSQVSTPAPPPSPLSAPPTGPRAASLSDELQRARSLYSRSRRLQQKSMHQVRQGQPLDLGEFELLTTDLIDSGARNDAALSCLRQIRNKDEYLLQHSVAVATLMLLFARHLGYRDDLLHQMVLGALLHDVGKVLVKSEILNKPGKLTDEEFAHMKDHARFGADIMKRTPGITAITLDIVANHHEKLDGSGYPNGLAADQLSTFARMITLCDMYDAMTSERVYHRAMTPPQALKLMRSMAPEKLDSELLGQFIRCIGLYPVGSMVALSNGQLAVVMENHPTLPHKPRVKTVYSLTDRRHIMARELELTQHNVTIQHAVDPAQYKLELANYL